eukprot:3229868-Prymnesium_polylepis.1
MGVDLLKGRSRTFDTTHTHAVQAGVRWQVPRPASDPDRARRRARGTWGRWAGRPDSTRAADTHTRTRAATRETGRRSLNVSDVQLSNTGVGGWDAKALQRVSPHRA